MMLSDLHSRKNPVLTHFLRPSPLPSGMFAGSRSRKVRMVLCNQLHCCYIRTLWPSRAALTAPQRWMDDQTSQRPSKMHARISQGGVAA